MQGSTSDCIIDRTVIFRADGNDKIGFGHIYRMLALIEMVSSSASKIALVTQPLPASLTRYISEQKIEHQLVPAQPLEIPDMQRGPGIKLDMVLQGDELVILDGYHFGEEYQYSIRKQGNKLIYIDDMGGERFIADVVINHAPGVKYPNNSTTKFFTGIDFALLRMPFFDPFKERKESKVAYVCMGGSDYFGYSILLLDLINQYGGFNFINLVFSSQYPEELISKFKKYQSTTPLKLHVDITAKDMVSLLDVSTHAFVSASTVLLECYGRGLLCYAGYYTKNQLLIYNGFINENLAAGLGEFSTLNFERFRNVLSESPNKLSQPLDSRNNLLEILNSL